MPLNDIRWNEMEWSENRFIGRIITLMNKLVHFLRENGHIQEALSCLDVLSYGDDTYECGDYVHCYALCYEDLGDLPKHWAYAEIATRENVPIPRFEEAKHRIESKIWG